MKQGLVRQSWQDRKETGFRIDELTEGDAICIEKSVSGMVWMIESTYLGWDEGRKTTTSDVAHGGRI